MALLATKLYVPSARADVLSRSRLVEQLDLGIVRPLTLMSAPAGYGKTTAVSIWAAGSGVPVAWLTLDAGDNDPARFWRYIDAALQTVDSCLGENLRPALFSAQPPALEQIIIGLVNDIVVWNKQLTLVIEDYHVIENAQVHAGVNFLLDNIPPELHIIITTRSDPPLRLGLRRGRGQISEIRSADLRFTSDETAAFINHTMHLALTEEDIRSLEQRTEGWIAGLHLAALSLQQQNDKHAFVAAFAGDDRYVMDYLLEEVLQRQPMELQTFLLKTSVLERLSGSLCEAVTEQSDGQSILVQLEQANLFVTPLDNRRYWYRYHPLFAELLRRRLHRTLPPSDCIELIRRACAWYVSEGLIVEAISQAFASLEYQLAVQLLEQYVVEIFFSSETMLVHHWLKSLPEEVLVRSPLLCTAFANTCAHAGTYQDAALQQTERWLDAAEKDLAISDSVRATDALTRGFIGLSRAYLSLWRRDPPQITIDVARRALTDLPPEDASPLGRNFERLRSGLTNNLGISYTALGDEVSALQAFVETQRIGEACGDWLNWYTAVANQSIILSHQGRLPEALDVCMNALTGTSDRDGESAHVAPYAAVLYQMIGEIHLEWNQLEQAEAALQKCLELSRFMAAGDWLAISSIALSRLQWAQGNLKQAFTVLDQVKSESPRAKISIDACKVRLCLSDVVDHPESMNYAVRWAAERSLKPFEPYWTSFETLTVIRVLIAQYRLAFHATSKAFPDLQALQEFLTKEIRTADTSRHIARLIELDLLQSLAWHAMNLLSKARTSLVNALEIAMPGGYIRLFVDEGEPVEKMLRQLSGEVHDRPELGNYVSRLLSAFEPASRKQKQADGLIEPLTDREMEVLRYIAEGCSNPEIASRLYLSPNTLKAHSQNIFMKLNVHNRLQAVNRARELGLIE
jgi:LuxR family maltose regulon positive regulatory protein